MMMKEEAKADGVNYKRARERVGVKERSGMSENRDRIKMVMKLAWRFCGTAKKSIFVSWLTCLFRFYACHDPSALSPQPRYTYPIIKIPVQ